MRKLAVCCAVALTAAVTTAAPSSGVSATSRRRSARGHHPSCEEKFDQAQRQDMESFRDYDAEAFREVHHPDATSVFAVGEVAIGRDAIMEAWLPTSRQRPPSGAGRRSPGPSRDAAPASSSTAP